MNPDLHRHSIRLKGYDYAQAGAYFVTLVTHRRKMVFGSIVEEKVLLTRLGEMAGQEWVKLAQRFARVDLDEFVVMPNHVHGIIVLADSGRGTGDLGTNNHQGIIPRAPTAESFGVPVAGSIPTILRSYKASVTQRFRWMTGNNGEPLWQRNYYEHIIRGESDLNVIWEYILGNPLNWAKDEENPADIRLRGE